MTATLGKSKKALASNKIKKRNVSSVPYKKRKGLYTFVLTPGGYRKEGFVKKAPKKGKKRVFDYRNWKKRKISDVARTRKVRLADSNDFINYFGPPTAATLNPHWVAFSAWNNNLGRPVSSFIAKIKVPPPPTNIEIQTIFIFIGIQNTFQILQPVLQWGESAIGGGDFWSVGSWFAGGQGDPVRHSESITRVQPGDEIIAEIEMIANSNSRNSYRCGFRGINNSQLIVSGIPELKYCCVTLESYFVDFRTHYPNIPATTIRDMVIRDNQGPIQPPWQDKQQLGALNEHALFSRIPGSSDQVRLFY